MGACTRIRLDEPDHTVFSWFLPPHCSTRPRTSILAAFARSYAGLKCLQKVRGSRTASISRRHVHRVQSWGKIVVTGMVGSLPTKRCPASRVRHHRHSSRAAILASRRRLSINCCAGTRSAATIQPREMTAKAMVERAILGVAHESAQAGRHGTRRQPAGNPTAAHPAAQRGVQLCRPPRQAPRPRKKFPH